MSPRPDSVAERLAFRFAPSPTGYLHIGHALSAMIGFELARKFNARFVVRIEDTDVGRCRPQFVDAIFDDLAWLGLEWEKPVWCQSERLDIYADYQERLRQQGLLYPCFATRSEITAALSETAFRRDPEGAPVYPGLHKRLTDDDVARRIAAGEPMALRLDMAKALALAVQKLPARRLTLQTFACDGSITSRTLDPARWGDVVIARKDTGTSYHLAGVIDDAAQGITHVCRGRDLEAASDIHRLLQVLLDLPEPIYHHHPLVLDARGRKLSKSAGDTALHGLRRAGWTASDVRKHLRGRLAPYID